MQKTRFERIIELALLDSASRYATPIMVELQAVTMLAVFANYFRITVEESPGVFTYPSIITVIEAPSGAGKNAVTRLLENFVFKQSFQGMRDEWYCQELSFKNAATTLAEKDSFDLFPDDDKKSAEKRAKHVEKKEKEFFMRKRIVDVFTSIHGSYEGFAFDRAYLEKFSFGAPYIRVEEYGNLILEMKQAHYLKKMYDSLVDLVDNAKLTPKSIKDREGATPGSDGMGITCLFTLSNPTEKQKEYINSTILQAVGRRGFLVAETIETLDHDRAKNLTEYPLEDFEFIANEVLNLFESLQAWMKTPSGSRVIPMSEETRARYIEIKAEVGDMYSSHAKSGIKSDKKMQIATLIKDLDRKILKLAVLFAIFNHGEASFEVTMEDLELARQYGHKFFKASKTYFDDHSPSNVEKILAFLQENKFASARRMWDAGLFKGVPPRSIQPEVDEIIKNDVTPVATERGFKIVHFKKRKATWYKLEKMTAEELEEARYDDSFEVLAWDLAKGE